MNIKIDIKIKNIRSLLANANISLLTNDFGWIIIKDFQIWESNLLNTRLNDKINIVPILVNVHGKYIVKVFIEDSVNWEKMEKAIYEAYKTKLLENAPIPDDLGETIF